MNSSSANKRVLLVGLAVFIVALPVLALAHSSLNGSGDQLKGVAAVNAALRDPRVKARP